MATENILSREIVEIATKGVMQAEADIARVQKATGKIGGSAAEAQSFVSRLSSALLTGFRAPSAILSGVAAGIRRAKETMEGLAAVASRVAAGGGLGIGGIIAAAARGTVEGERFGQAIEQLTRTIGDAFAPYVRMATAAVQELTTWFGNLSQGTKDAIAQWSLITAGVASLVAFLPVAVAGVASLAGVLAALTSPAVLAVGAIAALTVAAGRMFGFFQSGGADMADGLNQSNQTWLGSLVKGIGAATTAMARMFNWVMEKASAASDWIAERLAMIGELWGILPPGTVDMIRKMPTIVAPQIDVGAVDQFFGKVQRGADKAVVGFEDLIAQLQAGDGLINRIRQQANFGQGFTVRGEVQLESLGGTWDRIMKNLGGQDTDAIARKQLQQQEMMNEKLAELVQPMKDVAAALPAVR